MAKINTAERVSAEASDNFVFQRSLLAYHAASARIAGDVLEIGTGAGYGIEVAAPRGAAVRHRRQARPGAGAARPPQRRVPAGSGPAAGLPRPKFRLRDLVPGDRAYQTRCGVRARNTPVLRPGGRFIVTTPNAPMSLTRNPWHVREYTAEQLRRLLAARFSEIETLGVFGNEKVMDYYAENRRGVERITRFDILDLQHRLPRWMLQIPYDILNRMNRRKLLRENTGLTTSIRMDDYRIEPVGDGCFDLFYIAVK